MKAFLKLVAIGIIAGGILGVFLKLIEKVTDKPVYTLLMNVDYIQVLKDAQLNARMELLLHLIVSVLLVIVLYFVFQKYGVHLKVSSYIVSNAGIGVLLYGITAFSDRTPDLLDLQAFLYWISGHLIYGAVVWVMFFIPTIFTKRVITKKE
ncbi:hypothetical protein [Virgibacillus ainsalahensis]